MLLLTSGSMEPELDERGPAPLRDDRVGQGDVIHSQYSVCHST
jgi:hypothetical protein